MRISPLASLFALALFALGPVACSADTESVEDGDDAQGDEDDVQVEVASTEIGTRATCGTFCTRTVGSAIACNLTTNTGRVAYTCKPRLGASYSTGCVTNRGSSYCLSYF